MSTQAAHSAWLKHEDGIDVIGEAADGLSGVDVAMRSRPDIVLMDIRMAGIDGLEATGALPSRTVSLTRH